MTRQECSLLLFGLDVVVATVYAATHTSSSSQAPPLPKDLDTALGMFALDAETRTFAMCPKEGCSKRYPILDGAFAETCSCGTDLGVPIKLGSKQARRPRKPFETQVLAGWIGWMLSCPSLEQMMEDTARNATVKEEARDVWDGKGIHEATFQDGYSFTDGPVEKLRLAFAIAIDWWNAFHSGPGKKQWSIGAIYLFVLNLPSDIRYRPENICLIGIIPGPRKPSQHKLHNNLQPLFDELKDFNNDGFTFSRTVEYTDGRLALALLLLIICDLDACRAVASFSPHSASLFCSYCYLKLDEMANTNPATWTLRTGDRHREDGLAWLAEPTEALREKLAQATGAHYVPVMEDLPYFDLVRGTVPDVPHMMLLGNIARHFRVMWRMDVNVQGGDSTGTHLVKPATVDELRNALAIINTGKDVEGRQRDVSSLYVHVLKAICAQLDIFGDVVGRKYVKANLLVAIRNYVS